MSGTDVITFEDELWEDMDEFSFRTMPSPKDEMTIAWCLWHSARIEDITMNILVTGGKQIINTDNYIEKMNVEGANWLIDFWGKKDVAGILLMPATRHHLVHINESLKLKEKCKKLEKKNRR